MHFTKKQWRVLVREWGSGIKIKWISTIFAFLSISSIGAATVLIHSKTAAMTDISSILSTSPDEQQPPWFYEASGGVNSISISSDGYYIVAGGGDNRVYLFLRTSSTPLWSYQTGGAVRSVSISSNGGYVVAGSRDGKVYFFSRENGLLWSYQMGPLSIWSFPRVSISADGNYVGAIAGGMDNKVYLFSRLDNTPLWSHYTTDWVSPVYTSISLSSDGSCIATNVLGVYFFSRGSSTPLWEAYCGVTTSISLSSDGSYIATSGYEVTTLLSRQSDEPLWSYDDPKPSGLAAWGPQPYHDDKQVSISSNGEYIVSCVSYASTEDYYIINQTGRVHLFSRSSNTPLWTYEENEWIYLVSISSDGSFIAAANDHGKVYLFSRGSNTPLRSWTIRGAPWYVCQVNSISISSDGSYVAVGSSQGVNLLNKDAVNSSPVLSAESVSPHYGKAGETVFTFEVIYTDPDNDLPLYVKVFVGGIQGNMSKISGDYNTGALYRYTWVANKAGTLDYGFKVSDGKTSYATLSASESFYVSRGNTRLALSLPKIIGSNASTILTATLKTEGGVPPADRTVIWSASAGSITQSSTTNSVGEAIATFTAPSYPGEVEITASFDGDNDYYGDSESASLTVFKVIFNFKLDGAPLTNTEIYYGFSSDNVTEYLGTTDNEGKITSENPELANRTIYFKSHDNKYAGNTSVGTTGGEVPAELTEVSGSPVLWVIAAIAIVIIATVAVVAKKKVKSR